MSSSSDIQLIQCKGPSPVGGTKTQEKRSKETWEAPLLFLYVLPHVSSSHLSAYGRMWWVEQLASSCPANLCTRTENSIIRTVALCALITRLFCLPSLCSAWSLSVDYFQVNVTGDFSLLACFLLSISANNVFPAIFTCFTARSSLTCSYTMCLPPALSPQRTISINPLTHLSVSASGYITNSVCMVMINVILDIYNYNNNYKDNSPVRL